jgi:steroid delta-isomerase-like uncharacterized protein
MTVEEKKAALHRLYEECFNAKNLALIDELFAPDYVEHSTSAPEPLNREGFKQLMSMWFHAFPDFEFTISNIIIDGDMAAWREHWTGTHLGELMGIPPTGKRVSLASTAMGRFNADGQALEHWESNDNLSLMQQLGVIPPLGAPASEPVAVG